MHRADCAVELLSTKRLHPDTKKRSMDQWIYLCYGELEAISESFKSLEKGIWDVDSRESEDA